MASLKTIRDILASIIVDWPGSEDPRLRRAAEEFLPQLYGQVTYRDLLAIEKQIVRTARSYGQMKG